MKNPCDYFSSQNNIGNIKNSFIKNNIYKNQQFQGNNLFNFNKKNLENSFILESKFDPIHLIFYKKQFKNSLIIINLIFFHILILVILQHFILAFLTKIINIIISLK